MNPFKILAGIGYTVVGLITLVILGGVIYLVIAACIGTVQEYGWGGLLLGVAWLLGLVAVAGLLAWLLNYLDDNWNRWQTNWERRNKYILESKYGDFDWVFQGSYQSKDKALEVFRELLDCYQGLERARVTLNGELIIEGTGSDTF